MLRIKYLALIFSALVLVAFASCKGNKGGDNAAESSDTLYVPDDGYGDFASVDNNANTNESTVTSETETNNEVYIENKDGRLVPETEETHNDKDKFYIVAGSFTVYSNAKKQNDKLQKLGYTESKILEPYGQYNRVTIKEFSTREEARAALSQLRGSIKDQTLWLLKR
jgi:cell division protein FtsN